MKCKNTVYKTLVLGALVTITGCSGHKIETLGMVPELNTISSARNMNNEITNVAIVPTIGQAALLAASELSKYKENMPQNIVITSTVNVNNFKESSDFGRLFSESMIANFKRLDWNVIDFRGTFPTIAEKKGEFYLSRKDVKNFPLDSVIFVATYGEYNGGLFLNTRILDQHNNVLTASSVQLNDNNALALSKKSNCSSLGCNGNSSTNRSDFSIHVKQDDCSNTNRCELGETTPQELQGN